MQSTQLRRPRRVIALTAGIVLATVLTAAPAGADTSPWSGAGTLPTTAASRGGEATDMAPGGSSGQPGSVEVVPLSADLRITRTTVDADGQPRTTQETHRLYRDGQGRTRTEDGSTVTISDPATGVTIVLDTRARTFQRLARPEARGATITGDQRLASQPRPLGEAVVSGVRAEGRAYTVTVPAGRRYEVTVWASTEVQLPVLTRVVKGSGEVYEQAYTDLRVGGEPAAGLFQIPAGYRQTDVAPAPQGTKAGRTSQATCPIEVPEAVSLVSFSGSPGRGEIVASTDAGAGCVFVAHQGTFEFPLSGRALTPLFLPIDVWEVSYLGEPVPFLPYTAFGTITFTAAGTGAATVADTLIILQLF